MGPSGALSLERSWIVLFVTYPCFDIHAGVLHSHYPGCMFVVYDNLKEESIICFKPDTKRGNYTKKELGDMEKNEELGWRAVGYP